MCNHLEHQCLTLKFKRRRSEKPNPPAGDLAGASQALPDAVGGTHDANEYIMFGYYGHLQIETHDNWQKFNPMETPYAYYSHMQDFPKQEYQDEYPLKLIGTGPSAALKNPEEEGYFGHGYKPGGAEGQHFIAVAMLHLSQETVKQSLETGRAEALAAVVAGPEDAMAMHVKWHIIESVKELIDDGNFGTEDGGNLAQVFKAINCTVYYTIGFPDIVIIFQTKRLDWVSDICYALRARSVDAAGVDTGKPFLSASYLLCGMHVASKLESSIDESVENLRASIRFLLKQGKVPKLFFHEFINKMSERRVGVQLNEFGQMYGNSDVLWIPDAPLDGKLLNEYIKMDGLLNPAGAFYNEWIAMMRTSIRRVFEEAATIDPSRKLCPIDADADVVPDRGAERLILRWRQSLKRYCRERDRIYLISANAMNAAGGQNGGFKFEENSSRMLKGAEQMANLYYDLARSAHAYDLRSMLDPTLRVFRANMRAATRLLQNAMAYIEGGQEDIAGRDLMLADIAGYIDRTDESIDMFRHELNELLLGFVRSDRQFFESRTLLHVSASSATKVILGYARLIRNFIEAVRDREHHHKSCAYALYISCGGTSMTSSDKLFDHVEIIYKASMSGQDKIYEHNLIKVRLPERTIFRVGAALFMLMHETLHYVGYRDSDLRGEMIAEAIAHYMTDTLLRPRYSLKQERIDKILQATWTLEVEKRKDIEDCLKRELESRHRDAENKVSKFIKVRLLAESGLGLQRRSEQLSDNMNSALLGLCDPSPNSALVRLISKTVLEDMARVAEKADEKTKGELIGVAITLICVELGSEAAEESMREQVSNEIWHMFTKGRETEDETAENDMRTADYGEKNGYGRFARPIQGIVDAYIEAFVESFVDTAVCAYLGCKPWEYLAIFFFENENPTYALPENPQTVMRISSVLSMIDPDFYKATRGETGTLENLLEGIEEELKAHLPKSLQKPEHKILQYVQRIRSLLEAYRDHYQPCGIAQALEKYLKETYKQHETKAGRIVEDEKLQMAGNGNPRIGLLAMQRAFHESISNCNENRESWRMLVRAWMDSANIPDRR